MLVPSLANKSWVRLLAVSAAVAAAARSTAFLPAQGIAFAHLAVYGTWLGAIVWTTFFAVCVAVCLREWSRVPWDQHRMC